MGSTALDGGGTVVGRCGMVWDRVGRRLDNRGTAVRSPCDDVGQRWNGSGTVVKC